MSTWDSQEKAGNSGGYEYNENNLTYNAVTDPDSGLTVSYNGIGTITSFTNLTKH